MPNLVSGTLLLMIPGEEADTLVERWLKHPNSNMHMVTIRNHAVSG